MFSISMETVTITRHATLEDAQAVAAANSDVIFIQSAADIAKETSLATQVVLWNSLQKEKVLNFSSKKVGAERVWGAINALLLEPGQSFTPPTVEYLPPVAEVSTAPDAQPEPVVAQKAAPKKKSTTTPTKKKESTVATKKTTGKKKATAAKGLKPRVSKYAGKALYKKVSENPRREGTHGYKSFAKIKNGMSYEAAIAAGARRVDIDWDIKHGNLDLKAK